MARKKPTVFQALDNAISGNWKSPTEPAIPHVNKYDMSNPDNTVIYRTSNKEDYLQKKLELQQDKFIRDRWVKANVNLSVSAYSGLNNIKLMYRDADLMDAFPEIGAALDIVSEESTIVNDKGMVVNVYSKSDRIKNILEDLFVNRLNIQLTGQMIIRAMCKYGNQFMLLDIDHKNGVKGWKQLPVFNVERIENGIQNPYGYGMSISVNSANIDEKDLSTQFIWIDENQGQIPFRDWQIAHFRLLTNSLYLPYGVSYLNAARRHWRMLSLMEDMMLIYRLERSIERRVYKIFVGAIDDADVPAYVEQIANEFKRTPIIDPITGQVDLRKNILSVDQDIFIPVRDENAPTPIDTLSAAQNMTALDDIKFVQGKVLTALRIPRTFLNFDEAAGDGKNLALMDIRFTRTVNRIQQAFLMELTKVATIHLFLLGFEDELTNFTLSMNNPSTQAEQLEIENMQKKIDAVRDAVSDPGNGLPVMSQTRALKQIMKWSDKEIKENLEEIRLEKGIAAELEKTAQIIKKTGIFDTVDRIYGEPGAEYMDDQQGGLPGQGGPGGGGGGGMGAPPPAPTDFGSEMDNLGAPGAEDTGDMAGQEGSIPTTDMGTEGAEQPNESISRKGKKVITEQSNLFEQYLSSLTGHTTSPK
ncbi:MAG: portal protein, partial [Bacteroidaceae bacterium]|nr:portal protein [Bacteroidaceae bacterium]